MSGLTGIGANILFQFLISRQKSLLSAAVAIVPAIAMVAPSTVAAGFIVSKTKRFRTLNVIAWGFVVTGSALLTMLTSSSNKGEQFGFQIIFGIGGGIVFMGRICAMQASQKDADVPMGTALISFFSSLGQAFGVAIGGIVFQNVWDSRVRIAVTQGLLPAQYIISSVKAKHAASIIMHFPVQIQEIYRNISANTTDSLFEVIATFSGVAMLGSLFSKNLTMDRESKSEQHFVDLPSKKTKEKAQEITET
jgi:hypothetical protein